MLAGEYDKPLPNTRVQPTPRSLDTFHRLMDVNEEKAERFLRQHRLDPLRFSKVERSAGKTPDYRIFRNQELEFFCEVKGIDQDAWLDKQLTTAPPGTLVGGARPDPTFNRLTGDIYMAVKQFDAVNADLVLPNVLIFVNHDSMCGFMDLLAVTTGRFFADSGVKYPIYRWFSEGRIKDEKMRVHLYVWLDDLKEEQFLFNQAHPAHLAALCDLFGVDPGAIENLGA